MSRLGEHPHVSALSHMSVEAGGVPALFTAWSQHGDPCGLAN
jgi:hypothetical protein